jgi:hypothetical protein
MPRKPNQVQIYDPMLADGIVYCAGVTNDPDKFCEFDPLRVQSKYSYIAGRNIWISKGCTPLVRKKPGRRHIVQRCTACNSSANNLERWMSSEIERKRKENSLNLGARSELDVVRDSAFHVAVNATACGESAGFNYLFTYYRGLCESGKQLDNYTFELAGSQCFVIPCQGIPEQEVSDMMTKFSLDNTMDNLNLDQANVNVNIQHTNAETSYILPPLHTAPSTLSGFSTGMHW